MVPVEVRELAQTLNGLNVLKRIDLTIKASEIVAIRGANGVGKTTLLRCLAGCMRATAGLILWFGDPSGNRATIRQQVGYVAHESFTYPELSVRENLLFAARMHGLTGREQRVTQRMAASGLLPREDQPAGRLSKGWRQRLSIARALIHDPAILILDEPFAPLDIAGCQWLEQSLHEQRERGCAVCLTGHDAERLERISDRFLELRDGRLEVCQNRSRGQLRSA